MGFLNVPRRRNLSSVPSFASSGGAYYSSWSTRDTRSKLWGEKQLGAMRTGLFSRPGSCFALSTPPLPALASAPRRCASHRPAGQLIKVCILILSFVLLWDYSFSHLKAEQYAKNSDPVNKEGTSQGAAVVQHERRSRNLLGEKLRTTSVSPVRQLCSCSKAVS